MPGGSASRPVGWDPETLQSSPLFAALGPILRECPPDRFPTLDDLNALARGHGLHNSAGLPIRFESDAGSKPREWRSQYEIQVYERGVVPTRVANAHDLFNALVWLAFPKTKATLNRWHYNEMSKRRVQTAIEDGSSSLRGISRDVLTLFDESGAIAVCADEHPADLLRGSRWKELFWSERAALAGGMRFFVFGHAIHDKAQHPYKALTAKAMLLEVPPACLSKLHTADIDAMAAAYVDTGRPLYSTRSLLPLPLMGIPGWWNGTQDEAFYDDILVFRPKRTG